MPNQPASHHPRPHLYTHGGLFGHIVRRFIHVSTLALPLLYYHAQAQQLTILGLQPKHIVILSMVVIVILDILRLLTKVKIFGQRKSEKDSIASFTWSAIGIGLVLLLAPGKQFAIPIIWSCALGDPLLGELKCIKLNKAVIAAFGVVFIASIWVLCHEWLGTPWWLAAIMGPLITAAEWPSFKWIDDNALMQLVPLGVILLLF